ncbi:hypothetical protein [Phyllobacterium sp. SB3]|uniref:hypothetical protein n=1 Tax=Phyllobacterium sp. SB3 TaxID=3156073 RepID=UPI0032AFA8C5
MAKYFIIGETGSNELWLIDTEAKTAEILTEDAPFHQYINKERKNKDPIIKGISIAISSNSRSGPDAKMTITDPAN